MKHLIACLTILTAFAAEAKSIRLSNAEGIFKAAASAFPTAMIEAGDVRRLAIKNLTCFRAANEDLCSAITFDGHSLKLHTKDDEWAAEKILVDNLWNALTEAGIRTYASKPINTNIEIRRIILNDLQCVESAERYTCWYEAR